MKPKRLCKDCNNVLGKDAYKCPQCGATNPTTAYYIAAFMLIALMLFVFAMVFSCMARPA